MAHGKSNVYRESRYQNITNIRLVIVIYDTVYMIHGCDAHNIRYD